ncbi:MAG: hypothetical protein II707_06155, partial [Spirochaetales bacterium]|nr:hypothetical protein [Spirochaetales bacterium]
DYTNLNDNLTQMKLKIDQDVGAKIAEGKKKLDDEYAILHEELNNMYLQEIDDARKKYEQTRAELDRSLADYKKDAAAMSQNLKFTDKEYTSKYMEHSSFLDKKINQIKVNMDEFEKKTKIFDKAFDLKNQLTADMEELKDTIRSLRSDKERINDIEKQIREIETLAKSTLDKSSSINAERKKIDNMSVLLTQLKNQVDETTDKFSELKIQGDIAERLNEKIAATNERYEKMEKVFRSLDETEQNIKTVSTQMDIISQNFENYSHRADAFEHRLTDLDGKRETYQKKFESFEKDSKLILQSEQDINDVREQFKQLDILQQSLTRRQDEVNRLTTKVNDAMVKYGKIDMETDNKIRVLEALLRDANDTPMMKNVIENDDDRRTAIIKLKKQGFTIDEIANSLHITRQEAQMQLDLGDESDRRGF